MARRFLAAVLLFGFAACRREHEIARGEYRGAPVIVISIDTLRSDHLPAYGYAKVATPAIDGLAADGILFERAYSNVPLTLPSHASILTGLLPFEHGVRNNIGYPFDAKKHPPITVALHNAGYATGAMVSSYILRGNSGLAAAFDVYDDAIASQAGVALGRLQRSGLATLDAAKPWIEQNRDKPFFLLFHIYEPHGPYEPPEPFRSQYGNSYDGEIAAADDVVGKLLHLLRDNGLYDRAIVILLSDHGEGLNDHGEEEHGVFLYREALQVPLIIKLPKSDRKGKRISSPVELTYIAPTIAFLSGVDAPTSRHSMNLFDTKALNGDRALYAETFYPRIHLGWSELRSLIAQNHQYIEAPKPELYDLAADPAERKNVLNDQRRIYSSLRRQLSAYDREIAAPASVDSEEQAKLAALGYVGSVKTTEGPLPDPKDHIAELGALQEANRLTAQGRQKDAVVLLRKVLSSNPRFSDAWAKLGSVYEEMGRYDDAIKAYGEGLTVSPTSSAEFALSMAGLFLKTHRLDDARKHAELALTRNPTGAHQFLARIALESGDLVSAEREANLAMGDASAKAHAMLTLAQIRARQGKIAEAVQILENARAEASVKGMQVEQMEFVLGDLYAKMDRLVDAEAALRREIAAFPSNLTAYSSLGVVLVLEKKYDAVDPLFASMAEKNPSRQAYLVAAQTYETLGDARTAALWRTRAERAQ